MGKFIWEFPLTASICFLLIINFLTVSIFLPQRLVSQYFLSYPGSLSPVNWFLSTTYHGSIGHLLSNVAFLFFLGRIVEEKVGKVKWLLYYTIAGIISSMGDSLIRFAMNPFDRIPTVGASGAICGIAAVSALISPYSFKTSGKKIIFPVFLVAWTMIYADITNLFTKDNIAHWAHLGGYFSVFLTAYLVDKEEKQKLKNGFIVNLLFFLLSMILLYLMDNR
ncbi:MAG: rhomboid family intramembrane serine protease [Leptospiraceae bacterium]|nr:rhomboid family intramembrane serine protease [Leptospiraceae bacterium]MCP5513083.1 rhomboid family intramembrane serine protease [Leptospiraceae bacterium]